MRADLPAGQMSPRLCPAWQELESHAETLGHIELRQLLDDREERFNRFSAEGASLLLDYSRQRVTQETLELLLELAEQREVPDWIEALLAGALVNGTESRPALHTALRADSESVVEVNGKNVVPDIHDELARMLDLADQIHSGDYTGHSGSNITDVVNIGIGGSDLGLVMVSQGLAHRARSAVRTHFVSNIDGVQLSDLLTTLDPDRTLFIICSKSFTTQETRLNAEAARDWLLNSLPDAAAGRHFIAVSVNEKAMDAFGIGSELRFSIWDWVGGRYSLWSAIGLVLAVSLGRDGFSELLVGARAMDEHFSGVPLGENLPVLMGLLGVWNQNFLHTQSLVVLPYDQRLSRFPAFLQQLDMESNGKRVRRDGEPVDYATAPVVWGEPGSNAQHSFFQALHQGTLAFAADFLAPARGSGGPPNQHLQALANMLAQADAFALGRKRAELVAAGCPPELIPHREHSGNHPSSIILMPELCAETLGALIALYEHRTFVQSIIWGINAFDQWGVELGKQMAGEMARRLSPDEGENSGLAGVIRRWRARSDP